MGITKDMQGLKFGQLTVIEKAPKNININDRHTYWKCRCDCGKEIIVMGKHLRMGKIISCGCSKLDRIANLNKKHGLSNTRLFNIWLCMKDRCTRKNNPAFKHYGGRGIKICEQWQEFKSFYDWATNNGYNDTLSIDRIDVNGNYEPSNCRWVNRKVQANNKTNNHIIEYQGQQKTLSEWAYIFNLKVPTLWARLKKGWNIERALTTSTF